VSDPFLDVRLMQLRVALRGAIVSLEAAVEITLADDIGKVEGDAHDVAKKGEARLLSARTIAYDNEFPSTSKTIVEEMRDVLICLERAYEAFVRSQPDRRRAAALAMRKAATEAREVSVAWG
jgi:hypothetical protein